MTQLLGIALALIILAAFVAAVLLALRRPFRALGILVAGMAFHHFVLMVLILVLFAMVARLAVARWRSKTLPSLQLVDWLVGILAVIAILYAVVPHFLLHSNLSLSQAVIGLRTTLLIPLLYLFGRVFKPEDRHELAWVAAVIVGSAGLVGLFGLWELWLVPTATWLSWGGNQFSAC